MFTLPKYYAPDQTHNRQQAPEATGINGNSSRHDVYILQKTNGKFSGSLSEQYRFSDKHNTSSTFLDKNVFISAMENTKSQKLFIMRILVLLPILQHFQGQHVSQYRSSVILLHLCYLSNFVFDIPFSIVGNQLHRQCQ